MPATNPYPARPGPPRRAAELLTGAPLTLTARGMLRPDATPAEFLRQLVAVGYHNDALTVIAAILPPRLRIWWACLCVRGAAPRELSPTGMATFDAVVRWVRRPSAANARATRAAAEAAGPGELGYRLALAVAGHGEADDSVRLVALAVLHASGRAGPEHQPGLLRQFILFGVDVERGVIPLPPPESSSPEAGRA